MRIIFHRLRFFQLPRTFFTPCPYKFSSLLIREAIPNAITSDYYEIVIGLELHFLDVGERGHLMLFPLFNITIRSCLYRRRLRSLFGTFFLFLFELVKEGRVLVLPISYGP